MSLLDTLSKDLRFAARQLRTNPQFTTVAVLSLALGIGANTAIFQLVDAVRLRTLPVENPQELAYVDFAPGSMRSGWFSTRSARLTYSQWQQIQAQQQGFSGMAAWSANRFNLAAGGEVRYAEGLYVSGDFFRVLGVRPMLGRGFSAQDDQPGCGSPGAVISYGFWQRELAADPGVLGRTVSLDGHPFPIVGVTPASFFGVEVGNRYDVALPLCADRVFAEDGKGRIPVPTAWWLSAMGRLKPGWSLERASAQLRAVSPRITEASLPPSYRPEQAKRYLKNKIEATEGATGVSGLRSEYQKPLWLLLATTGLVLLIACANLTNLLLARASVREREIAVRQAIGASRARLIRQLLAESLLLALVGTALGAALAQALTRALIAFLSRPNDPLFLGLALDGRMLAFTSAIAVGTCLLFGLLPAIRATRISPASVMRASGRGLTAGRERFSLRRALVVAQVAMSLVLLVGALLFATSLRKLINVDPGFRPEGVIAAHLDLRRPHYSKERLRVVFRELLDRLRAKPGIVSAAEVGFPPVSGSGWNERAWAEGSTAAHQESFFDRSGPGYFRTMATAFLAGRDFDDRDNTGSTNVAIVNEAFAKRFFGGANPVGRSFRVEGEAGKADPMYQVIGLVRNTKYYELREDFRPIAFLPAAQDEDPGAEVTYVLRTSLPAGNAFRAVKSAAAEVHPEIDIEFRVMSTQLKESLLRDRLMATLAGAFGVLAGLLATVGLYGVIAYMVARRRNEIGVRVALGADRGRVIRLVMGEAAVLLAAGVAIGAALALWAGKAAGAMLFGVKPGDPLVLAGAAVLLGTVSLFASYAPARRAARTDPMNALREE
jgi:putative ABC transport system permease protein